MTLVSTVALPTPTGVEVTSVETAAQMGAVVLDHDDADVIVMAAAVADFRPKQAAETKLKKDEGLPEVVLEQTPDILAELGRRHRPGQVVVGFAAETAGGDDLQSYAEAKLRAKHADLIVANDVSAPGVGFSTDTNAVLIVSADHRVAAVPLTTKEAVAIAVADAIAAYRERLTEENP